MNKLARRRQETRACFKSWIIYLPFSACPHLCITGHAQLQLPARTRITAVQAQHERACGARRCWVKKACRQAPPVGHCGPPRCSAKCAHNKATSNGGVLHHARATCRIGATPPHAHAPPRGPAAVHARWPQHGLAGAFVTTLHPTAYPTTHSATTSHKPLDLFLAFVRPLSSQPPSQHKQHPAMHMLHAARPSAATFQHIHVERACCIMSCLVA